MLSDADPTFRCSLCGLTLPTRPILGDTPERRYCCAGCQRVDEVIRNLDPSAHANYIEAARRAGLIPSGDGGGTLDEEETTVESGTSSESVSNDAIRTECLNVTGFECPSCAWVAQRLIRTIEGVSQASADFMTSSIKVTYDMRRTAPSIFAETLQPFGYRLDIEPTQHGKRISHPLTLRFTISAILTMNLMTLAVLRYGESLGWLDVAPVFLIWGEAILASVVLWYGGMPIIRRALFGLFQGRIAMDFLITLAALAAYILSIWALLRDRPDIYFETCAGLVTISLLSRMIEARLRERACRELAIMMRMPVRKVRVETDDGVMQYRVSAHIIPGDRVVFEPGELIPFDGVLLSTDAWISEAVLTGESAPVQRVAGDRIVAGSEITGAPVRVRVTRGLADTRLHEIADTLRGAIAAHELSLESADRIALWFGPLVVLVAVGTWVVRSIQSGADAMFSPEMVFPSIAVLATACPCAFSLAGVTALTAATGSLLRRGILVKNISRFERVYRIGRIVLDKTGTVTRGMMSVEAVKWRCAPDTDLLTLCGLAETGSRHPAGAAVFEHLQLEGIGMQSREAGNVEDVPGAGRRIALADGGVFQIGAQRMFETVFRPEGVTSRHTVVYFGIGSHAEGCFLLADTIRPEAVEVIQRVEALGIEIVLLSGDREETVSSVARELGIGEAHGGVTLEQKVQYLEETRRVDRATAYVGDGTNDALAMQAAEFGIAVARATDEALTASDAVMLDGGLSKIPLLLMTARTLRTTIWMNYIWAFAFNIVFIPVAAMGYLTPLAAMGLMLISSTLVLVNSVARDL